MGSWSVGAKWGELLVIQDGEVFWLDDETPHTRYWRSQAVAATTNGAQAKDIIYRS